MGLGGAPELAARVVLIDGEDLPAIFVEVESAAGVAVRGAGLELGLDHPDAVQFVAREVLVDVERLDDVVHLHLVAVEFVGVVRDDHLPLADELPRVAVGRAAEHVELVGGAEVVGCRAGIVVGNVGGAAHAALAGVVEPAGAFFLHLVERLVDDEDRAGEARGGGDSLLVVNEDVFQLGFVDVGAGIVEEKLVLEIDEGVAAVALGSGLADVARGREAAVARQVVPDRLKPVLRDGEGRADERLGEAVALVGEGGGRGVAFRGLVDALGVGGGAVRGIDDELVVGIRLEQRELAGGEQGLVLGGVFRRDRVERRFAGKRVRVVLADLVAGGRRGESAVPRGDGAGGIAGALAAERGEVFAKAVGLIGADGRDQQARDKQPEREDGACGEVHGEKRAVV
ncbi:MAG: hypothetical protein BWX86_02630 [Verrucomicrobia bacterium ADurb.Bin122]|nr:MAG: hypothetical protein BWX86_02630 [Verrucomicrobia bacterium ADurb.Bin122]